MWFSFIVSILKWWTPLLKYVLVLVLVYLNNTNYYDIKILIIVTVIIMNIHMYSLLGYNPRRLIYNYSNKFHWLYILTKITKICICKLISSLTQYFILVLIKKIISLPYKSEHSLPYPWSNDSNHKYCTCICDAW